jgi:hypothetical protein
LQVVAVSFLSVGVLAAVLLALANERRLRGERRAAWGIFLAVAAMAAVWLVVIASVAYW